MCTELKTKLQPSSLPLSERLRFFSSLSEASNRSTLSSYTRNLPHAHAGGYSSIERSASASSYSYYAPSTPRSSSSSVSTSDSLSVTPTPMDYSSISIHEVDTTIEEVTTPTPTSPFKAATTATSIAAFDNDNDATDYNHNMKVHESTAFLKLNKSASHTLMTQAAGTHALEPHHGTASPIATSGTLAPTTRRMKLKTIGKLMLPQTFLNNDRNHNTETSDECLSGDISTNRPTVKKIGKIKSPFIENCQQMQQKQKINSKCMKFDLKSTPHNALSSLENNDGDISVVVLRKPSLTHNGVHTGIVTQQHIGRYSSLVSDDSNADSGKENYCDASSENVIVSSSSPVVEMRKKFSRIINNSLSFGLSSASVTNRSATQPQRSTYNGHNTTNSPRSSLIEDKYAKYFGLKTTSSTKEKENTTARSSMNSTTLNVAKRNMQNMPDVCQVTPKLRCSGLESEEMSPQSPCFRASSDVDTPPLVAAINQNVRLKTSTPFCTPPSSATTNVIEKFTPAGANTSVSSGSALKRREMAKRSRAMTTIVTTTYSNLSLSSPCTPQGISGAAVSVVGGGAIPTTGSPSSMRSLRARALTITHGVQFGQQIPEVKKFEDIIVTKEEFQLASKEFERIFLSTL